MKLKVLLVGAPLSTSGYGYHARTILDSLKLVDDKIDLHLMMMRFSNTSNTYENKEDLKWYTELASKFNPQMLGHFDISIQIGVPTEWKKYAKYNIGVTAGVETLTIPEEWIEPVNSMEKVITISNFSKRGFVNTKYDTKTCTTSIEVIPYPVKKTLDSQEKLELDITTEFNFLSINQWAPRKNIENMLFWFLQEFANQPQVGLILKTYTQSNSTPDYYQTRLRLHDIINQVPDRKCKVYLIHGDMKDEEINYLSNHQTVKAYINNAHGEGFGLSVFDAACAGLPIVAPDFSGYKDYLYQAKEEKTGKEKLKPFFQKVLYDMNPVQQNHIMPGIIHPGMIWAYPQERDFKHKIREVYKDYGRFKKQADELKKIILSKYEKQKIDKMYIDSIFEHFNLDEMEDEIIEVQ